MGLEDFMHSESNALAKCISGEIQPRDFVNISFELVDRYTDFYRRMHGGSFNIKEVAANIRQYEYNSTAGDFFMQGIEETDKKGHLALTKWYCEFFLKFYLLNQVKGMTERLQQVRKALESGPVVTLVEITDDFNVVADGSRIKDAEKYLMRKPDRRVSDYYFEAPAKYRKEQLARTG